MLKRIDLSRTDLNLLVLLEALLEERHVGRVAQRMHLTPSAVSHRLGRLRRLFDDPLFLRTPRGVVPTVRATELAAPVAEVLARVRSVVSNTAPFDPATSTRGFAIGAPDGVAAVFLPPLLARLRREAPGIDIRLRQLLPPPGEASLDRPWRYAFAELDARAIDVAIVPTDDVPARFAKTLVYEEDFVIAMRDRHPFRRNPSLARYCEMRHLVVSMSGDASGFVDEILARRGHARRVAATVPNFMLALAVIADSDLVSALPRSFVAAHGRRFGVVGIEPPLALGRSRVNAVVPAAAMQDRALPWLLDALQRAHATARRARSRPG